MFIDSDSDSKSNENAKFHDDTFRENFHINIENDNKTDAISFKQKYLENDFFSEGNISNDEDDFAAKLDKELLNISKNHNKSNNSDNIFRDYVFIFGG